MKINAITCILADALNRGRTAFAEIADAIKLAIFAKAGRRGAQAGEILRRKILKEKR